MVALKKFHSLSNHVISSKLINAFFFSRVCHCWFLWESICHFFDSSLFYFLHCLFHFVRILFRFIVYCFLFDCKKFFLIFRIDVCNKFSIFFNLIRHWKVFCIHVKLTSSSVDFNFFSSAMIVIVFEFQIFFQTNQKSINKLNENTKQLIVVIIAFNRSLSLIALNIKNINVEKATFSESIKYSIVWVIDAFNFRRVIQKFREHIVVYKDFQIFLSFFDFKSSTSNNIFFWRFSKFLILQRFERFSSTISIDFYF